MHLVVYLAGFDPNEPILKVTKTASTKYIFAVAGTLLAGLDLGRTGIAFFVSTLVGIASVIPPYSNVNFSGWIWVNHTWGCRSHALDLECLQIIVSRASGRSSVLWGERRRIVPLSSPGEPCQATIRRGDES